MVQYAMDKIKEAIQGLPADAMEETSRNLIIHDYQRAKEDIQGWYTGFTLCRGSYMSLQIISNIKKETICARCK